MVAKFAADGGGHISSVCSRRVIRRTPSSGATRHSDSRTEQSTPASARPRGRDGDRPVALGRAPDPKGPFDLGHQRNVGFASPTLYKSRGVSAPRRGAANRSSYHETKLSLRALPPSASRVRVRKGGFVPSSDAVRITSPQRVPEPVPCPCGGGGNTSSRRREECHCDVLGGWVIEVWGVYVEDE